MWRWTITDECGQAESYSCRTKDQALYQLMSTISKMTITCPVVKVPKFSEREN